MESGSSTLADSRDLPSRSPRAPEHRDSLRSLVDRLAERLPLHTVVAYAVATRDHVVIAVADDVVRAKRWSCMIDETVYHVSIETESSLLTRILTARCTQTLKALALGTCEAGQTQKAEQYKISAVRRIRSGPPAYPHDILLAAVASINDECSRVVNLQGTRPVDDSTLIRLVEAIVTLYFRMRRLWRFHDETDMATLATQNHKAARLVGDIISLRLTTAQRLVALQELVAATVGPEPAVVARRTNRPARKFSNARATYSRLATSGNPSAEHKGPLENTWSA